MSVRMKWNMNKIEIILEKDNTDYENSPVNIIVKNNEDEEPYP